jgi:hypothetical protein
MAYHIKYEKIPASRFLFEKSAMYLQISVRELFSRVRKCHIVTSPGVSIIGYCEGKNLPFRPNEDTIAIMFQKNGEDIWCHVAKSWFNEIHLEYD